jgi:NAD(P)-dependent dehydrogenase (short-subunit alcohol dehydrogenase family)
MKAKDLFDLNGKTAIVTGGSGLIGRPICKGLAEAGCHVIIASRNLSACEALAQEINGEGGLASPYSLDLSSESDIIHFTEKATNTPGSIDILVNNAVSRAAFSKLEDTSRTEWEKAQQVNSTGLMTICREIVPHMVRQKNGSIINISSIQGAVGPNFNVYENTELFSPVNYSYDKWGMIGFTKWMANYYGKYNIRVNSLSPGGYGPGIRASQGENEFTSRYKKYTPLGRFVEDDDIKGAVVFLASAASAYITGQNILLDGGWTSW